MNDSGFWIVAKMSGLTEMEALKSWTPMLAIMGITTFVFSLVMAFVLPLA
jgi:GntP family gluconate:H+ symporter